MSREGSSTPRRGDLVRLLYLDEAGVSDTVASFQVAGVLVHGDRQWPEIDRQILSIISRHIPEADRVGFVFHATDLFHGSGYFKRGVWPRDTRLQILADLAMIIHRLNLPVVASSYTKEEFAPGVFADTEIGRKVKRNAMHSMAILDCLRWADVWLEHYAPNEIAVTTHEDGTVIKAFVKAIVEAARSESLLVNILGESLTRHRFPLKRIIDTIHFSSKQGARPLQLADLCAFVIGRSNRLLEVPEPAHSIIAKQLAWVTDFTHLFPPPGAA